MVFKNISHTLEMFPKELELSFRIVETLLSNLNFLTPSGVSQTTLKYESNKFRIIKTGYSNSFFTNDIKFALLGDIEKHKEFILKHVKDEIKDYNLQKKSDGLLKNTEGFLNNLLKYYGFSDCCAYPLYSDNTSFKLFIKNLHLAIHKVLNPTKV